MKWAFGIDVFEDDRGQEDKNDARSAQKLFNYKVYVIKDSTFLLYDHIQVMVKSWLQLVSFEASLNLELHLIKYPKVFRPKKISKSI